MQPGTHIFYSVQHRRRATGPWLKLDAPVRAIPAAKRGDFSTCGNDYWGGSMQPRAENTGRARDLAADDDRHAVWCRTGHYGWSDLADAKAALERVKRDDAAGMYDSRDTYGKLHQRVRHEFRIIKTQLTYAVAVVHPGKK